MASRPPPDQPPARPAGRTPLAGGFLIAVCATIGIVVGLAIGEVTPAFLIGLGTGCALAIGVWAIDRRH